MKGIKTNWTPDTEGAFSGVSFDDYLGAPGVNKSKLMLLAQCPAKYQRGPVDRDTPSLLFGRLAHAYALEQQREYHVRPDTYQAETGQCPKCGSIADGKTCSKCKVPRDRIMLDKNWNEGANVCKTWMEQHADAPVVPSSIDQEIIEVSKGIRAHSLIWPLMCGGRREISLFGRYRGRLLKCRPDLIQPTHFLDLKTAKDASNRGLGDAAVRFGYDIQAAICVRVCDAIGLEANPTNYYLVGIERLSGVPPVFNVRRLSDRGLQHALRKLDELLDLLDVCEAADDWPDYSGHQVEDLDLPSWAIGEEEEPEVTIGGVPVA